MAKAEWGNEASGSVIRIDRTFIRDAESSVASFGSMERIEAAAILGLVGFEQTGAVAVTGYVGLVRYLEVEGAMSRADAVDRHRLIRHCGRFPLTASALESGEITVPYLRVLASAAVGLADQYEAAEAELLGLADGRDVATFERAVSNWRNRAETAAGAADPARPFEQRGVSWQRGFDGSGRGQFSLDPIAMDILETALDTPPDPSNGIEKPRTLRQRRADALIEAADYYNNGGSPTRRERPSEEDDASQGSGPAGSASTDPSERGDSSAPNEPNQPAEPNEPAGAYSAGGHAGRGSQHEEATAAVPSLVPLVPLVPNGARQGTKTIVDVIVDLATLEGRAPEAVAAIRAEFASGVPISDAVLEQVLCDASYRRLIIDGPSVVLDHSSPTADISTGLRRAVQLRDGHCQFAGCDRPWHWCDVHHLQSRADDGRTNERNLALVCRYHHTLIHQVGWHLGRDPTTGELVTTSP